jgi:transposase-like protein
VNETHSPSEPAKRQDGAHNCPECASPHTHLTIHGLNQDSYECENCGHEFVVPVKTVDPSNRHA